MSRDGGTVTREMFITLDENAKLTILFDTISETKGMIKKSEERPCKYHKEMLMSIKALEKRKVIATSESLIGGIIGGGLTVLGKAIFWR
jgi:hypothetical protein